MDYLGEESHILSEKYCDNGFVEETRAVVIPETVGQFTGLYDKNGTKIFEGDIVSYREFGKDHKSVVEYEFAEGWYLFGGNYGHYYGDTEIIGNIYDNPELLEGEK